jgi:hypothetical protein
MSTCLCWATLCVLECPKHHDLVPHGACGAKVTIAPQEPSSDNVLCHTHSTQLYRWPPMGACAGAHCTVPTNAFLVWRKTGMPLVPPCKPVPPAQPHLENMPAHAARFTVVVYTCGKTGRKTPLQLHLGRPAADSKTFQTGTVPVTAFNAGLPACW